MNQKQSNHLLGDADETLPIKYTSKNGDYFIFLASITLENGGFSY